MNPEDRAREKIDELLEAAGWRVQDRLAIDLGAGLGIDDLELAPFHDKGGPVRAYQTFGRAIDGLLKELNEVLSSRQVTG